MNRSKKKHYRNYKIIIAILLILLIGEIFVLAYSILKDKDAAGSSAHIDTEASEWDDGIEDKEEMAGRILVPGYSGAKMKTGDTLLKLRIGNPKENTCYLQATLQLENGTILYQSGFIEPGKGYEEIELTQALEPGEYHAFVHYQGYSMDENSEMLNSCDSAFVLKVTE